jgi:pimeloyl-ACP methyl ester carboxylesterase
VRDRTGVPHPLFHGPAETFGGIPAVGVAAPKAFGPTVSAAGAGLSGLPERLNADPEFLLAARYWDVRLRLEVGEARYDVSIDGGKVSALQPATSGWRYDVRVTGPLSAWTDDVVTKGMLRGAHAGRGDRKISVDGDGVAHVAPYLGAVLRIVRLIGESLGVLAGEAIVRDVDRRFDTVVGRYVYVRILGTQFRVYFEEAGRGDLPLILHHTAGADGRQWRHLLEDPAVQSKYRVIAFDLPFHGKSLPPSGEPWWAQEYRATTESLMATVLAISGALELERPVFMGCSIGGYLAADLAYHHPREFSAVIGINAAVAGAAVLDRRYGEAKSSDDEAPPDTRHHPRIANSAVGSWNYMNTSPASPEASRREVAWMYGQGGPGVLSGDSHYYRIDHDLTGGKAEKIDTSQVEVHLLSGEYDRTAQPGPGSGRALADAIEGSTFQIVEGGGHFVMSDDYPRFRRYIIPLLDEIHARHR